MKKTNAKYFYTILFCAAASLVGYYYYREAMNDPWGGGFYDAKDVDFSKTDKRMNKLHSGYGTKTVVDGMVVSD